MDLERYLRGRLAQRQPLLMTHVIIGYPSLAQSFRMIEQMVDAGVDLIELQIPFSEPIADGPVIVRANQKALAMGTTLERCFAFAEEVAARFPIPFLFMSYYNLLFKGGVANFVQRTAEAGLYGSIVPDLPPEEASSYLSALGEHALAPIFIFSPNTSDARLRFIAEHARGFVYCVARKGVTGSPTEFSAELDQYLARCRRATPLPLGVGFGISGAADVAFLRGKADIAIVGSQTIRVLDEQGVDAVGAFIAGLR